LKRCPLFLALSLCISSRCRPNPSLAFLGDSLPAFGSWFTQGLRWGKSGQRDRQTACPKLDVEIANAFEMAAPALENPVRKGGGLLMTTNSHSVFRYLRLLAVEFQTSNANTSAPPTSNERCSGRDILSRTLTDPVRLLTTLGIKAEPSAGAMHCQ
jgi:hypothetical protein